MTNYHTSIDIEKGKPFKPAAKTIKALEKGAREAHEWLNNHLVTGMPVFYPDEKWLTATSLFGAKTMGAYETDTLYNTDIHGSKFFMYDAPPHNLGPGSFYLIGVQDANGELLQGGNNYTLHVPANVPAQQFWALDAYDFQAMAFIRESPKVSLSSLGKVCACSTY